MDIVRGKKRDHLQLPHSTRPALCVDQLHSQMYPLIDLSNPIIHLRDNSLLKGCKKFLFRHYYFPASETDATKRLKMLMMLVESQNLRQVPTHWRSRLRAQAW